MTTALHGFEMNIVEQTSTPFYYYSMDILHDTLREIDRHISGHPFVVHYAETFIIPAWLGEYVISPSGIAKGGSCMVIKANVRF